MISGNCDQKNLLASMQSIHHGAHLIPARWLCSIIAIVRKFVSNNGKFNTLLFLLCRFYRSSFRLLESVCFVFLCRFSCGWVLSVRKKSRKEGIPMNFEVILVNTNREDENVILIHLYFILLLDEQFFPCMGGKCMERKIFREYYSIYDFPLILPFPAHHFRFTEQPNDLDVK